MLDSFSRIVRLGEGLHSTGRLNEAAMDRAIGARVVKLGSVKTDSSDFLVKNEPGHPAADANGNVKLNGKAEKI